MVPANDALKLVPVTPLPEKVPPAGEKVPAVDKSKVVEVTHCAGKLPV